MSYAPNNASYGYGASTVQYVRSAAPYAASAGPMTYGQPSVSPSTLPWLTTYLAAPTFRDSGRALTVPCAPQTVSVQNQPAAVISMPKVRCPLCLCPR